MWQLQTICVDLRLGHFLPGFLVPINSYPALLIGFFILFALNYSLTYTSPTHRLRCTLFRVLLAPFALLSFYQFGYGAFYTAPANQVYVGMATVGLYGMMRTVDSSMVTLIEAGPPRWVRTDTKDILPMPKSTKERLAYAFDYSTSLRGTSWFQGVHWDWAPKALVVPRVERKPFIRQALKQVVAQYMLVDVLDTLNKSLPWSSSPSPNHPITSLSPFLQILFSLSVCLGTLLAIVTIHTIIALVAVTFLGSPPEAWPPMFAQPLGAISLADFWARRWHAIFRRVFARLSLLVIFLVPERLKNVRTVLRAVVIFALSATLHVLLMYRLQHVHPTSNQDKFLDPSILAFFLAQPVGLALEAIIVRPAVRVVCRRNRRCEEVLMRVWTWTFMLWAGRFWSDVWVKRGLWGPEEHVVGYSLVRGILMDRWKV